MDVYENSELLRLLDRIATALEKITSNNTARAEICPDCGGAISITRYPESFQCLNVTCQRSGKLSPVA
jgi:RNA polymerase-binding transcription factor DksA